MRDTQVVGLLSKGAFESRQPLLKEVYYSVERAIGHALFRRFPPGISPPRLLNLGCGPLHYSGWVNADEFAFKRVFRESAFRPDWRLDIKRPWKCLPDYWDGIFTQHVIEHLYYSHAMLALGECFRTLRPGAWLRVSVPSAEKTVRFYESGSGDPFYEQIPRRALSISFLAQMHFHKSVWDAELMSTVLRALGFEEVSEVTCGLGTDPRLAAMDQDSKEVESLYLEARKPE
jgi:predicted SAM-dependent methyltransferase